MSGFKARVPCRPGHARRLAIATVVFAAAVLGVAWMVSAFILRDLSQSFVSRIITQAKGEAEAVAHVASDQGALGEADTVDSVHGGRNTAIDADALLAPFLPHLYDGKGQAVRPLGPLPQGGAEVPSVAPDGPGKVPATLPHDLPANLTRTGQEMQVIVNGELVRRDAFNFIEIRYPGGHRFLNFRSIDVRDVDPKVFTDPANDVNVVRRVYRPSSQPLTISWDSTLNGQPVKLSAGIDPALIDEGVAELRHRMVPKVVAGAAVFVLLLGIAYAFVVRLLGEARRLEAESNQQAMLAQVGMLAAGLAHEIRNPLSAVQMNLQLIEEDIEDEPPALALAASNGERRDAAEAPRRDVPHSSEHLMLLQSTQREIRRLGSLVTDFLTYARPASPRRAPHDIDAVVRDCMHLFGNRAAGEGIALDVDLHAGEAPVLLDEAMLKQAIMNIVVNAIEAVPRPGGRIMVTTRRDGSRVQVAVADNGPGLPGQPEALFQVFHSTKKGGTGLGLAIARAIAERHGGSLNAMGGEKGGAVFVFTLPADAA